MTDIVERLRKLAIPDGFHIPICGEAADEIDRLRKRVAMLEEALSLQVNTEFGRCPT